MDSAIASAAPPSQGDPALWRWMLRLCPLAWVLLIGGPLLLSDRQLAYRDVAHFYYPTFRYIQREWSSGRVPLWNPYSGLGAPLLAQGTGAVFYPAKAVFFLLPFDSAFKVYLVLHLLLAAYGARQLARHWRAGPCAATLAALAYAGGGQVLSQTCNPPFLVSSAWLPVAVLWLDRVLNERRWGASLVLAGVLTMFLLCGDPQIFYHLMLVSGVWAVGGWRRERTARKEASAKTGREPDAADTTGEQRLARPRRALLLSTSFVLAAVMSAVQVLPSWELAQRSTRTQTAGARSLWELLSQVWSPCTDVTSESVRRETEGQNAPRAPWYRGLLAGSRADVPATTLDPTVNTDFSVAPWRWPEFLWPNFGGRQYPQHQRWIEVLPAEGRAWAPTLFMGSCTVVLAWVGLRAANRPLVRLLATLVAFGLLAGLGRYGLVWMAREMALASGAAPETVESWPAGDACGGLYWLMNVLLPGYVQFRYPGKLLVFASLGGSLLAALGWEQLRVEVATGKLRRPTVFLIVAGVSLAAAVMMIAIRPWWEELLADAPRDPLFGPLRAADAWRGLCWSFLQTLLVLLLAALLVLRRRGQGRVNDLLLPLLLGTELALGNAWLLHTAPIAVDRPGFRLARDSSLAVVPWRVSRPSDWYPQAWAHTNSDERLRHAVAWEQKTLSPKYELLAGLGHLQSTETLPLLDWSLTAEAMRDSPQAMWAFGANILLMPAERKQGRNPAVPGPRRVPGLRQVNSGETAALEMDVYLFDTHAPRAWAVERCDVYPALRGAEARALWTRTQQVVAALATDPQGRAMIEVDDAVSWRQRLSAGAPRGEALPPVNATKPTVRITHYQPQRVVYQVSLARPALLVCAEQYDPGWSATAAPISDSGAVGSPRAVPIVRANRVLRGIWLPAGRHQVVLQYAPASFFIGAWLSAAGTLAWLCGAGICARARRRV